eukprot:COSAG01_NODE_8634_length_2713_cov_1.980107_4_plen_65_part_00
MRDGIRWGRTAECPGECPYLSGEYATYFVRGYQRAPEDPQHLLVGATCSERLVLCDACSVAFDK